LSGINREDEPEASMRMTGLQLDSKNIRAICKNVYALCTIYCAYAHMRQPIRMYNNLGVAGIAAGTGIGSEAGKSRENNGENA
jgi:hypothetical protein